MIVVDVPEEWTTATLDEIEKDIATEISTSLDVEQVIAHRDYRFIDVFTGCIRLSSSKGNDYSPGADPYANVRGSEEFGVPAWIGGMIRMMDKVRRLMTAARGGSLKHESVEDSFDDLINYGAMGKILFREYVQEQNAQRVLEEGQELVDNFFAQGHYLGNGEAAD